MHTPTWRCLLTHCCHHPHACSTTGYGPLDQGAINQFYEAEIKGRPISKDFNAKVWSGWVGSGGWVIRGNSISIEDFQCHLPGHEVRWW